MKMISRKQTYIWTLMVLLVIILFKTVILKRYINTEVKPSVQMTQTYESFLQETQMLEPELYWKLQDYTKLVVFIEINQCKQKIISTDDIFIWLTTAKETYLNILMIVLILRFQKTFIRLRSISFKTQTHQYRWHKCMTDGFRKHISGHPNGAMIYYTQHFKCMILLK